MGDDLNFAQKFTRTAADGLALIAKMDDPRAAGDAAVVIDMMTTLQRGAKRLRARNIYASAQDVLSALHHEEDTTLNGRIHSLGSLVTEYARGLGELVDTAEPAPALTRVDKWDAARETLNAMLPKAHPSDADVLSRLMRAPVTLETVQPETASEIYSAITSYDATSTEKYGELTRLDADIVPFIQKPTVKTDAATITLAETHAAQEALIEETRLETAAPQRAATFIDESPVVTLDAMMREVIADALSVARSAEKTISLSYDMGERTITEYRANELRSRLGVALSQIIRLSMTDDRVGHIDINLAGEQLHIMAGTTAVRVAIDPAKAPAPKPDQKPLLEPEQGLREQLHSLMDPSTVLGTVS